MTPLRRGRVGRRRRPRPIRPPRPGGRRRRWSRRPAGGRGRGGSVPEPGGGLTTRQRQPLGGERGGPYRPDHLPVDDGLGVAPVVEAQRAGVGGAGVERVGEEEVEVDHEQPTRRSGGRLGPRQVSHQGGGLAITKGNERENTATRRWRPATAGAGRVTTAMVAGLSVAAYTTWPGRAGRGWGSKPSSPSSATSSANGAAVPGFDRPRSGVVSLIGSPQVAAAPPIPCRGWCGRDDATVGRRIVQVSSGCWKPCPTTDRV